MPYTLEKLTPANIQRIISIANEKQLMYIKNRKFYEDNNDLNWAINCVHDHFLVCAPSQEHMTTTKFYFFCFNNYLFDIAVPGQTSKPIQLLSKPADSYLEQFKSEIVQAFLTHRLYGFPGSEYPFSPIFDSEVASDGIRRWISAWLISSASNKIPGLISVKFR